MKLLRSLIKPIASRVGPRLAATGELRECWNTLSPVFQKDREDIAKEYLATMIGLRDENDVVERLLDAMCERDRVFLANGVMRFSDRYSLRILINEILVNEDYYFETDTDSPRILDCGTHFGLAIYYFKSFYPQARITGFEPIPELRELALENVRTNGYGDVEILPFALSERNEKVVFVVSNTSSMAGSLTDKRRIAGDDVREIEVECRKLSDYLREPVHFLKLDIEGSEDVVLSEAEPFLGNVQHIFCEYHHGNGLGTDRLMKILHVLDRAGFDVQVGKAFDFERRSVKRPMTFVGEPYSAAIWAKNRVWKG